MKLVENCAVIVGDALDHTRRDVDAIIGKGGEPRRVFEQGQIGSAQGQWQVGDQPGRDSKAPAQLNHFVHSNTSYKANGRHVPRFGERVKQGNVPLVLDIV